MPAFVLIPPIAACFALAEIHRQQWLSTGCAYLALRYGVGAVAEWSWLTALVILGMFAAGRATSPATTKPLVRGVAVAASWAMLLYPLQQMLMPSMRELLMQNERASLLAVTLIAMPQSVPGAAALWLVLLRELWKFRGRTSALERLRIPPVRRIGRWALVSGVVLGLAPLAVRAAAPEPAKGAPNIIFIVVDTLRADHLGMYGYTKRPTSPRLDALARDAVVYDHAVTPAPWTTPAVASMLTARYPRRLGFREVPVYLAAEEVSVAERLMAAGYRTDAVVSNMFASSAVGFDCGFESMDESQVYGHMYVSSAGVTDRALKIVEGHRSEPFFLYLHYFDPHFAYVMHEGHEFDPAYKGELRQALTHAEFSAKLPNLTQDDIDFVTSAYDSEIAFTDENLGRLFDRLRALGLYDNTLIVFTGDHGEEFAERGDHFIGHGRTVNEELVHVPLIVKWPHSDRAGTRVAGSVTTMDIAPTVLAAAGTSFPPGATLDGVTLDQEVAAPRMLMSSTRREAQKRAVYDGTWKLIIDRDTGEHLLYDLASDAGERIDVKAAHPDVEQRLLAKVDDWEHDVELANGTTASFGSGSTEKLRGLGYVE